MWIVPGTVPGAADDRFLVYPSAQNNGRAQQAALLSHWALIDYYGTFPCQIKAVINVLVKGGSTVSDAMTLLTTSGID